MDIYDNMDGNYENYGNALADTKYADRGYNKILRRVTKKDGYKKQVAVEIYTSGGIGSNIRDAETGEYCKNKVGSIDEHFFYKVKLATGECKSRNGSSTLYFRSPQHFMSHMHTDVSQKTVDTWMEKHDLAINGKLF